MALGPKDGNFRTTLALAEYRAGHWAESIAAAERSIALTKGVDASNWFFLAMAPRAEGRQGRVPQIVRQGRDVDEGEGPQERGAAAVLAEAAELLGQPGPESK